MSTDEIFDIAKVLAPLLIFLGTVVGYFYNMYFKVKVIKDYDKIFFKKDDVQKIYFMDSLFNYFLFIIGIYVAPATAFSIIFTEYDWSYLKDLQDLLAFILFIGLIIFFISLIFVCYIIGFSSTEKKLKYSKRNLIITAVSLLCSAIFYYFLYYNLFFDAKVNKMTNNVLLFPILLSIPYTHMLNFYKKKTIEKYYVQTINKDDLDKLHLIQSHMIDDNRIFLYEKNVLLEDTFYVCDFSSEVYLRYQKQNIYNPNKNKIENKKIPTIKMEFSKKTP
ncbi:hypothetical protein ACUTUE_09760 [Bacillus sp. NA_146.1]|uniref:hypothetical protein n=1 Tax=Bacillus wiedmannii TaxID=1890302 RepID=UPI000BF15BFF|nr:hypothetical protein [Bacillus wiedmannii]PEL44404.1 hypothetical protein CN607_01465 [Bacillus wiedmannii]